MNFCGIYRITNVISGRSYVGQSVNIHSRWKDHSRDASNGKKSALCDALRSYGIEGFAFVILEECPRAVLNESEQYWIATLDSLRNGYNLIAGGIQARELSDVTRERMRNAQLGKKHSEGHKAKISAAVRGAVMSDDFCRKLSERMKGVPKTAEARAKMSAAKKGCIPHNKGKTGFVRSQESREKQSRATKGVPKSPEHRASLAAHLAIVRAKQSAMKESENG
jgi:group I intron endonuclease